MTDKELAEAYAAKTLGKQELQGVETRMANDPPFAQLVNEYENTLEVLKRKWLRNNIEVAKKELWVRKLIKLGIVVLALSSLLFIAGYHFLKSHDKKAKAKEQVNLLDLKLEHQQPIRQSVFFSIDTLQTAQKRVKLKNARSLEDYNLTRADKKMLNPPTQLQMDTFKTISLNNVFSNDFQIFEIDPNNANELKCKNGTIINLPAHALVLKNGLEPKGKVSIHVQEFSNYLEMYKHNVTTSSNGKLLETGGSCYIKAESNGDSVMLKENQTYTIAFPSKKDMRMKTFVGERDTIGDLNWIEDKVPSISKDVNLKSLAEQSRPIKDCDCNKEIYRFQTLVTDEGFYNSKTDEYSYNVLSKSKKVVELFDTFNGIITPEIKTLYKLKSKLRLRFGVDSLGKLVRFDYNFRVNRKTEKAIKEAANFVLANAQVDLLAKGAKNVIITVDLVPTATTQTEELAVIDTTAPIAVQNKAKQSNMNILVARSFGYINCDYFLNKSNLLTKLVIKIPSDQTDVKVFFKSNKVVARCSVSGNEAAFANAPENETILIVGTVMKNNKWTMALKEAKVGDPIELKDFEAFDLNKISTFLQISP